MLITILYTCNLCNFVQLHTCLAKSLQSCLTLCNPVDYILPGSSVHGILRSRILEWSATPSSRGSPDPGVEPRLLHRQAGSLPLAPLGEPLFDNVLCCAVLSHFRRVQLFEAPWTVAHQDPLAMGLSQHDARVGFHFLLQGTFLIQRSNPHLLQHHHWQAGSYPWLIFN